MTAVAPNARIVWIIKTSLLSQANFAPALPFTLRRARSSLRLHEQSRRSCLVLLLSERLSLNISAVNRLRRLQVIAALQPLQATHPSDANATKKPDLFSEFSPGLAPDVRLRSLTEQAKCQRALPNAIHLAAWSNHGATVVRIEEGTAAVPVNMRVGSIMSLLGTTTGRVFGSSERFFRRKRLRLLLNLAWVTPARSATTTS